MIPAETPAILVSQATRAPLFRRDEALCSGDGTESFPVRDGIIHLLDADGASAELNHQIEVFDTIPVRGLPYFREPLYRFALDRLATHLEEKSDGNAPPFRFAELGGGEGHLASHATRRFPHSEVYVCDTSTGALSLASPGLRRICADITRPVFTPGSLNAAALWVSLHHIPPDRRRNLLDETFLALGNGGLLIVFEPNGAFLLRKMLYKSSLRKDVYFDDAESAVDFAALSEMAETAGFEELETLFLNPPYNPAFVRMLKRWRLYLPVVELLHRAAAPWEARQSRKRSSRLRHAALYGLALFRKTV